MDHFLFDEYVLMLGWYQNPYRFGVWILFDWNQLPGILLLPIFPSTRYAGWCPYIFLLLLRFLLIIHLNLTKFPCAWSIVFKVYTFCVYMLGWFHAYWHLTVIVFITGLEMEVQSLQTQSDKALQDIDDLKMTLLSTFRAASPVNWHGKLTRSSKTVTWFWNAS